MPRKDASGNGLETRSLPHAFGNEEGKLDCLRAIQTRIATRSDAVFVATKLFLRHIAFPTDTLCNIGSRHGKVDSARMAAHSFMNVKEGSQFGTDGFKVTSHEALLSLAHEKGRIADPKHMLRLALRGTDQIGQLRRHGIGIHPRHDRQLPRSVERIHHVDVLHKLLGRHFLGNLETEGVVDSPDELQMGSSGFPHEQHVGRAIVRLPGGGVGPRQSFLQGQYLAVMCGIKIHLRKCWSVCIYSSSSKK